MCIQLSVLLHLICWLLHVICWLLHVITMLLSTWYGTVHSTVKTGHVAHTIASCMSGEGELAKKSGKLERHSLKPGLDSG